MVTHHGKDAHVLISLDDYRRLDGELPTIDCLQASLPGLVEALRDGVIVIDRDWRIATINAAASDMLERPVTELVGLHLADALPGMQGNLLLSRINRLIDHRERFAGDVPSLLRPRQWVRVDLVPLAIGGAIIVRDISAAMEEAAASDRRSALVAAVEAERSIGYACLSVREAIEEANPVLIAMVGVDAAAVRRVRFSALLATSERAAFTEALEGVFRTGAPARMASALVTREGEVLPVTLAIAERRGAYASDGVMVLVTRA